MNRRGSRYLIAGLTAAAVLLLAVLSIRSGGLLWMENDPEREQSMTSEDPHAIRSVARREGDTDPGRAKRQMALQALKRRWLELEAGGNGGGSAEVMALARESAAQLLFSPETFQLLEFLKNRRMEEALSRTEDAVTMLLFSAGAAEARASLTALSSRVTPATPATQVLLEQWSFSAGRPCDRAEFEAFVASLHNERAVESATLGWNSILHRQIRPRRWSRHFNW
ncbi:MAG: hypothetical protein EOP88_17055 [Verrucomicrobiaceae bacterium]|nr:MAG: hypothetical protein EOP88_17055 [Verrucomicrobiaceae bacterium]